MSIITEIEKMEEDLESQLKVKSQYLKSYMDLSVI